MTGLVKSRFKWRDGWIDYRRVPSVAFWDRFRWDREDVPIDRRKELLNGCLNYPSADGSPPDLVRFERVYYEDKSFEFVERS